MKIKLLRKSVPFLKISKTASFGEQKSVLYITFLGQPEGSNKVKQFFCCAENGPERSPCEFSTLMFANEGDELYILPWRYSAESPSNIEGFGSKIISVRNLSHPEFNVDINTQMYDDNWDIADE